MASVPLTIEIRAETGLIQSQLVAIREFFDAPDHLGRLIACRAFEALHEVQSLGDHARADLGIDTRGTTLHIRMSP